jgi:hypothetical protein
MSHTNTVRLLEIDRDRLQADLNGLAERVQPLREAAQKALVALEYHTQQTRPIPQTEDAIKALIVALAA